MWQRACLNMCKAPSSILNTEETKITIRRDDWLKKYNRSQKKGHLKRALKHNSLMKWLMVKDMDIQLRMEASLGTRGSQSWDNKDRELSTHDPHINKRYSKNCIWKTFGQEIRHWERSYFQEAGEAT